MRRALLIAGPTASGKSAAALELAERFGATIVNADSMQVYRDLRILTARPTPEEERLAPHRLFGAIDGAVNFSAGRWARAAREVLAEIGERPVIFVGGTGLYFRALTEGLSDIPPVPEAVRAEVRAEAEGRATPDLHDELAARDPETAARLNPSDRQRILRALEVVAATGRPLARSWARARRRRLRPANGRGSTSRPTGRSSTGASTRGSTPCSRGRARRGRGAHGAGARSGAAGHARPWRSASHRPSRGPAHARRGRGRSKLDTRHYAKRQFTWARHQLAGFRWVAPQEAVEAGARALGES